MNGSPRRRPSGFILIAAILLTIWQPPPVRLGYAFDQAAQIRLGAQLFFDPRLFKNERKDLDGMNMNLEALVTKLNRIPGYVSQFRKLYGTPVTIDGIAKAISALHEEAPDRVPEDLNRAVAES